MTAATTADSHELVVEISGDGSTWAAICGITSNEIQQTANTESAEVPDCDDETKPHVIVKTVRSLERVISGSGIWSQEAHGTMEDWFESGAAKHCRIYYANAASSTPEYKTGMALLTQLNWTKPDKNIVTAQIQLEFTGAVTVTDKSA